MVMADRVERVPAIANGADSGPVGSNILNPPDSLNSLRSRLLIFLSFCALLIGGVWFSICISLYVVGAEYHVITVMYEARWLPCTVLFSGLLAAMLALLKTETFYIGCGFMALYNSASSVVSLVIYSLDFRKALHKTHPTVTPFMSGLPRRKYLQLCGCMIIVTLLGICVSILLLAKLWQLASWYYKKLNLHQTQKRYLILSALVQLPLTWFSIYVTSHVITLPFTYVHQYMIQELLCALILKSIIIFQALHYIRANRLTLKLLLILNGCQTVQEVFYTWNSYHFSLYIHTSKAKLATGAQTDQYLMSANFVNHFARMCIAAYTTYQLSVWLQAPFVNAYCRLELDRKARQLLVALAGLALLLAASHVIMDVLYTATDHIYRNLIAFTGISVFYLSLIGIALALFVRSGHILLLIIASVLVLLLSAVSCHALYIYVDTSYHNALLSYLETMGRDKRQSSYMHFAEAVLAFLTILLCLVGGIFIIRLLHIDSLHDRRDGRLRKPMLALFALGVIQLELAAVNAALTASIRDDSRVFQSMLAYGVLDSISMFVMCLTQIYVCRPANNHISYGLTALLLFLICEALTTYNYLSNKIVYIQFLIAFSQMFAGNLMVKKNLQTLFPAEEVGLMVAAHVVHLVQWVLTIVTLVLTAWALEILHAQRKELALSADRNAASGASVGAPSASVPLPAVSYSVSTTADKTKRANRSPEDPKWQAAASSGVSNGSSQGPPSAYDNPTYHDERKVTQSMGSQSERHGIDDDATPKKADLERGELLPELHSESAKEEMAKGKEESLRRNEDIREDTEEA